jgi:DNA modification methylase
MRVEQIGEAMLYEGDALQVLCTIPGATMNCCVTSPPYWGLRDYGIEPQVWGGDSECRHEWGDPIKGKSQSGSLSGSKLDGTPPGEERRPTWESTCCSLCGAWRGSLGLEPTPELYVKHIVMIFEEVRRVLQDDGTLWLNLGDSYAGGGRAGNNPEYMNKHKMFGKAGWDSGIFGLPQAVPAGLKPKDLVGIPWRVAFALQAAGWYLRSDIIWSKPNPMPESVTDRPTKAHEYIFLLSKSARYYYDKEAMSEPAKTGWNGSSFTDERDLLVHPNAGTNRKIPSGWDTGPGAHGVYHRNGRALWDTQDKQSSGRRMIENTRRAREEGGDHDSPFGETRNMRTVWTIATRPCKLSHFATFPDEIARRCILGGCPVGGTVLDPFAGTMTVSITAAKVDRKSIAIELSPEYYEMGKVLVGREYQQFKLFEPEDLKQPVEQGDAFDA